MKFFLVPTLLFLLINCAAEKEKTVEKNPLEDYWSKDMSSDMHAVFFEEENQEIDAYLKRHEDWKMTQTGTGLRYFVYQKSAIGDSVAVNDYATIAFEISLLNGDICYTSEEKGPETFMVEKTDIESGLHEAIKLMKAGDRAKFILPSHMAHGLIGDTDKIPPLSPVIYDIQLLAVKKS